MTAPQNGCHTAREDGNARRRRHFLATPVNRWLISCFNCFHEQQRSSSSERLRSAPTGYRTGQRASAEGRISSAGNPGAKGTTSGRNPHTHEEFAPGSSPRVGVKAARPRLALRDRLRPHINLARSFREILEQGRAEPAFHPVFLAVIPVA